MENRFKELPFAITICDREGNVLDMNDRSAATFAKSGGLDLIGGNLLNCHPEPAKSKLIDLLHNPRVNAYTIEKNGVKKLIYQTPWYDNGEFVGLMEISMEIPFDMPHSVRKPKTE